MSYAGRVLGHESSYYFCAGRVLGHKSLSILFRFTYKILSVRDPDSATLRVLRVPASVLRFSLTSTKK